MNRRLLLVVATVVVAHVATIALAIANPVAFKVTVIAVFTAMVISAAFADR